MMEQTVKCPICGEPYVVYAYYCGDQSACPHCRAKARRNMWDKVSPYKPSRIPRDPKDEYWRKLGHGFLFR